MEQIKRYKVSVYNMFGEYLYDRDSMIEASRLDANGHNISYCCYKGTPISGVDNFFVLKNKKQPKKLEIVNVFFKREFGFTIYDEQLIYKGKYYSATKLAHKLGIGTTTLFKSLLNDNSYNIILNVEEKYEDLKCTDKNGKKYYYYPWEEGDENLTNIEYLKKYFHVSKDGKEIYVKKNKRNVKISYNSKDSYAYVSLWEIKKGETYNGSVYTQVHSKRYGVHRLVAMWYLENYSDDLVVNHIDGNKQNNDISNLEMCTNEYNIHHAFHVLKRGKNHEIVKSKYDKKMFDLIEQLKKRLQNGFNIFFAENDKIIAGINKKNNSKWTIGNYIGFFSLEDTLNAETLFIHNNVVFIKNNTCGIGDKKYQELITNKNTIFEIKEEINRIDIDNTLEDSINNIKNLFIKRFTKGFNIHINNTLKLDSNKFKLVFGPYKSTFDVISLMKHKRWFIKDNLIFPITEFTFQELYNEVTSDTKIVLELVA